MQGPTILPLAVAAALATSCLSDVVAFAWDHGLAGLAGAISDARPVAEQSVPTQSPSKPSPKTEKVSCWHPGLPRNIGIAEPSCDVFKSKMQRLPKSSPYKGPNAQ